MVAPEFYGDEQGKGRRADGGGDDHRLGPAQPDKQRHKEDGVVGIEAGGAGEVSGAGPNEGFEAQGEQQDDGDGDTGDEPQQRPPKPQIAAPQAPADAEKDDGVTKGIGHQIIVMAAR